MKKHGKILFFNTTDRNGVIITPQKEKIAFDVMEWDEFDTMPSLGLEVSFDHINDSAKNITLKQADLLEESEELNDSEEKCQPQENEEIQHSPTDQEKAENENGNVPQEIETSQENFFDTILEAPKSQTEANTFSDSTQTTLVTSDDEAVQEVLSFEGIEEEYGEREESLTLTLNIKIAVENYFNVLNEHLVARQSYKKVRGRLNYIVIRRFLWTMYNNLSEIDIHIITPQIRILSNDLKLMEHFYDDFMRKIKYPALAYQEVFLACQDEYNKISKGAQDMMENLSRLRNSEKQVGGVLKVKKKELSNNINTAEFDLLQEELKSLNGAYVDIVHMMAELDERYKHDMELLLTFEKEYKEDFNKTFAQAADKHKADLIDVLNAQAFLLDAKLWEIAKNSKAVKAFFQRSSIEGELNTKTYLKYYLDSLDNSKSNDETKKLFDLYDYLVSLYRDCILIVSSSAQDAMDYESEMKKLGNSYEPKAFIDEKAALKWAMKHSVKVLIIGEQLSKMDANSFLKFYKKYIVTTPKIIVLGKKPTGNLYQISKLLSENVSAKLLGEHVKELMTNK